MKYDCGFQKENRWFRYRAGGIIIHDDKMLFVKSSIGDYYYMIGGGVHMGEASEKCIEREVFEEAGINASVGHLAVVCENFFKGKGGKIDGLDCHTIEEIKTSKIKPEFIKEHIDEIINGRQTIHVIEERDR